MATRDGYYAATVCFATGLNYRTLDYWARSGFFKPAIAARGAGSDRVYSHDDIVCLASLIALRKAGIATEQLMPEVPRLRIAVSIMARKFTITPRPEVSLTLDLRLIRSSVETELQFAPERSNRGRQGVLAKSGD